MSVLKKIDKLFVKIGELFLVFTILVMVLMVAWQVVCRFIIHMSVPYAEEFARLAIVWCIMIGGALAVRKNEHIRVDSLINILPHMLQVVLQIFAYILMLIFSFVIMKYGWEYTLQTAQDFTTSLGYCRNVFFVPAAIAGVIMVVYTVANLLMLIINEVKHTNYKF